MARYSKQSQERTDFLEKAEKVGKKPGTKPKKLLSGAESRFLELGWRMRQETKLTQNSMREEEALNAKIKVLTR